MLKHAAWILLPDHVGLQGECQEGGGQALELMCPSIAGFDSFTFRCIYGTKSNPLSCAFVSASLGGIQ